MFDLARAFAKKQEVESARLDEYWFRHRARTIGLLVAALEGRTCEPLEPAEWAGRIASCSDNDILADLRSRLAEPMMDADWDRCVAAASAEAWAQLIDEFGSPDPHRLA